MSLGGIATLLISRILPYSALYYIGITLFILNILYFALLLLLQLLRFTLTPASFTYTLTHPIECCFLPTPLLAFATLINCTSSILIHEYNPTSSATATIAGPTWSTLLLVTFWIYFAFSLLLSLLCYTLLFSRAEQTLHHMSPAWVLPIFPLMLCGSVSAAILPTQSAVHAIPIAVCGLACQGLGLMLSCMMYAVLLLRLMTVGFPPPKGRMGLLMCCGPPAFTILCLLGLSTSLRPFLEDSLYGPLYAFALASSIGLWLICGWFYLITVASLLNVLADRKLRGEMEFTLGWWAAIFPITGWANATWELGRELNSGAVQHFAQGMVVWLIMVFVGVAAAMVRAVVKGGIMKEGKDEDRVIDTMFHRYPPSSLDPSEKQKEEEEDVELGLRSNPPTYPSTPAVSVYWLDMKQGSPKYGTHSSRSEQEDTDTDVDAIHPLPPSTSSSSDFPSSTPTTPRCRPILQMTALH